MADGAIASINLADDGGISGFSSQVTAMPATNLLIPHVARRWRSTANSAYFIIDLHSLQSIDTIAVLGTTMSGSGQIRARVTTTDSSGVAADVYDSGTENVDDAYDSHVFLMSAPASARYVRVDLTDVEGTYVEAGRVFVGLRNTFTTNFGFGWTRKWSDRSIITKTRGGQTQVSLDNLFRTFSVTYNFVTATERNGFVEDIDRMNALNTDVLFVADTASSNLARDSVWGLMTDISPVTQSLFEHYAKQYVIEERL